MKPIDPTSAAGAHPSAHPATPAARLSELARSYHQAKNESKQHPREHREQRIHAQQQEEIRREFDTVLSRWVADESLQAAWRAHLDNKAAPPRGPELPRPPVFKGTSDAGVNIEIFRDPDDTYRIEEGGKPTLRIPQAAELGDRPVSSLQVAGRTYQERFDAPAAALDRLTAYAADPSAGAPWDDLRVLYEDGLVGPELDFTLRGLRLVNTRRGRTPGARIVLG